MLKKLCACFRHESACRCSNFERLVHQNTINACLQSQIRKFNKIVTTILIDLKLIESSQIHNLIILCMGAVMEKDLPDRISH